MKPLSPRIPVPLWAISDRSSACRAVPPGMRVVSFTTGVAFIARRTDEGCPNQARQHQSSRVIPVPVINSRSRQHSEAFPAWRSSRGESGDVKAAIRTLSVAGNAAVVDAAPRFNFTHSPRSFRALSEAQQWGVGEDLRTL